MKEESLQEKLQLEKSAIRRDCGIEQYLSVKKIDVSKMKLQEEEVAEIKYFTKKELLQRIANNYDGLTEKTGVRNFCQKILNNYIR